MSFHDQHNTFRAVDAFEFVDAYRDAVHMPAYGIRDRMAQLNARMNGLAEIPSYLLAAYRGYEAALVFVEVREVPGVIKIDDLDPTPCERLTAAGYQL